MARIGLVAAALAIGALTLSPATASPDITGYSAGKEQWLLGSAQAVVSQERLQLMFEDGDGDGGAQYYGDFKDRDFTFDGQAHPGTVGVFIHDDTVLAVVLDFAPQEFNRPQAYEYYSKRFGGLRQWLDLPESSGWIDSDGDIVIVSTEYGSDGAPWTQIMYARPAGDPIQFLSWYHRVVNDG